MLTFKEIKQCQKMLGYIDFYIYLLDVVQENLDLYIKTKNLKYRKQEKEVRNLLAEVAKDALKDV